MAETKSASKRKPSKPKAKARSKSKPKASASSKANGSPVETVEETAKQAGKAVGKAASKAKVPLIAGGAAVAGASAGIALSAAAHSRHRGRKSPVRAIKSDDLKKAAKKAGDFGLRMGEIAHEVRVARDHANHANGNGSSHRSPIEVVLEGLTSRGSKE